MITLRRLATNLTMITVAVVLASMTARAQESSPSVPTASEEASDTLIFVGTIQAGPWQTQFLVGNRTAVPQETYLGSDPTVPGACPPITGCPGIRLLQVPANGLRTTTDPGVGVGTTYVSTTTSIEVPAISARIGNLDVPAESVDVPWVKLSTIVAANPSQLTFAGARQGSAGRSNLVLANVRRSPAPTFRGDDIAARVDAFAADGSPLGSVVVTLVYGQTVFLGQVLSLSQVGVTELPNGVLRVTKIGGNGIMWGVLYSVDASGGLAATLGVYL
jgi:hypothetical protein